jgi:Luciferase-like monooxygenase
MFLMRFTERAYVNYTEEDVKNSSRSAVRLTFSNSHFDPRLGADLYHQYLDEYEYAEAMGFDGLMLNELKTWTTPGPFRWEGKHYHFRVVNPFELPLQKPHPPVWIPGTGSPETLVWCAERHYPYIYLETDVEATQDMIGVYAETARVHGYEPGPQHFGYLARIHVQDTDEKAREVARGYRPII